ncbi:MAG: DUF441 domain-containing protein [Firmicutes bacterium]|nr:DUF441 domain-containing protein [Bacillota bacterium]
MIQDNCLLLVILAIGLVFNNHLIASAAGSLLVLKLTKLYSLLNIFERRATDIGLLFLLIAVLTPFALDRVGIKEIWLTFKSLAGILAVIGGIIAAYLCGQGMILLELQPEVVVGLVIGTVIGVSLLKGIPVGPLAAAGVTALLLNIIGSGKR